MHVGTDCLHWIFLSFRYTDTLSQVCVEPVFAHTIGLQRAAWPFKHPTRRVYVRLSSLAIHTHTESYRYTSLQTYAYRPTHTYPHLNLSYKYLPQTSTPFSSTPFPRQKTPRRSSVPKSWISTWATTPPLCLSCGSAGSAVLICSFTGRVIRDEKTVVIMNITGNCWVDEWGLDWTILWVICAYLWYVHLYTMERSTRFHG